MCNLLHSDSKPIPENGFGYKIFTKGPKDSLVPVFGRSSYVKAKDWINWRPSLYWNDQRTHIETGFCFFMTKKEAEKMLKACQGADRGSYNDCCILKIQYRKGLGCHKEGGVITGKFFKTALCKGFKILE